MQHGSYGFAHRFTGLEITFTPFGQTRSLHCRNKLQDVLPEV